MKTDNKAVTDSRTVASDIEMGGMTEAQAATKLRQAFENFVPEKDSEATKMANWKIGGVCENSFPQSDSRAVAGNSIARNAYSAYISEGIADSDGNFIPMSFEAFCAWKHETLVRVFGENRFIE